MAVPDYFEFQDRTKVIFALDAIDEVGKEAAKLGFSSAILPHRSKADAASGVRVRKMPDLAALVGDVFGAG